MNGKPPETQVELFDTVAILEDIYMNFSLPSKVLSNIVIDVDNDRQVVHSTMIKLGLIDIVSYLDEFNNVFSLSLIQNYNSEYQRAFMSCIKPARSFINKHYPDLRDFRNSYLAHNRRAQNKRHKNVILYAGVTVFKVPQNLYDYLTLAGAIGIIHNFVRNQFPDKIAYAKKIMEEHYASAILQHAVVNHPDTLETELSKIQLEVYNIVRNHLNVLR